MLELAVAYVTKGAPPSAVNYILSVQQIVLLAGMDRRMTGGTDVASSLVKGSGGKGDRHRATRYVTLGQGGEEDRSEREGGRIGCSAVKRKEGRSVYRFFVVRTVEEDHAGTSVPTG